jgi:acid phosphatase (class A)
MRLRHAAIILALSLGGCVSVRVNGAVDLAPAPATTSFDGFGVLTQPPAPGSPQQAADVATSRGPWTAERTALAAHDDKFDPFTAFDAVIGADFTAANYPATKKLFDQFLVVVGPPIGATKARWQRARPFIADPAHPTCITPTDALRASGSFPSGHAAAGWGWGLLLAELAPAKADALLHRGFEYGESRVVCGVHWASDVAAGRALGAAAVARMHSDPGTLALIAAARAEINAK